MRAAVIVRPGEVEIRDVPDPEPGPGEVVVAVAAVGICGTDLHIFEGEYAPHLPLVPGHEFSGRVVAVGRDVTTLRVGDAVTADPNLPCWDCRFCRSGRVNLCENYAAVGVTQAGAAAELVVVPAKVCVGLRPDTDLVAAALAEPLACVLHAFDLVGSVAGRSVLVYGAGTMGLLTTTVARLGSATTIDVVDLREGKLAAAAAVGSDRASTSASAFGPDQRWDVVVDATGALPAIADGLSRVDRGGTFLQLGVSSPEAVVDVRPFRVYDDELRFIGSVCPADCFPRAVVQVQDVGLPVDAIVSDRIPLADFEQALRRFAGGGTRKVMVLPA